MSKKKKDEAYKIIMLPFVNSMLNEHVPYKYEDICSKYEKKKEFKATSYDTYESVRKIIAKIKKLFSDTNNPQYYLRFANGKDTKDGVTYPDHLTDPAPVMRQIAQNRERGYDKTKKQINKLERLFENTSIISFDHPTIVKGENLMPKLYGLIERRCVIQFEYNCAFETTTTVTIHPHFLKQYNRRWFLFGDAEFADGSWEGTSTIALDRIIEPIEELPEVEYREAPEGFYLKYLKTVIGVSHLEKFKDKIYRVRIRTLNKTVHGRIATKKLHKKQKEVLPFDPKLKYGLFELEIEPNWELLATLLWHGSQIKIEGEYLPIYLEELTKMSNNYL